MCILNSGYYFWICKRFKIVVFAELLKRLISVSLHLPLKTAFWLFSCPWLMNKVDSEMAPTRALLPCLHAASSLSNSAPSPPPLLKLHRKWERKVKDEKYHLDNTSHSFLFLHHSPLFLSHVKARATFNETKSVSSFFFYSLFNANFQLLHEHFL